MKSTLRARARTYRNRLLNPQMRMLRQARDQVIRGTDVLLLSDSTSLWAHPNDTDPAMIPELLSRELGGARIAAVAGPGYNVKLHAAVLRVLATLEQRPRYLITSISVRTSLCTHVVAHPVYRYRRLQRALESMPDARHWPRLVPGDVGSPEEYAAFRAGRVHTRWTGESTIGAFRQQLEGRGPRPWPRDLEQLLFDYFHGEEIAADHPRLEDAREFGRQVASYGVPCVSYTPTPPMERGEQNFPGEFRPFVAGKQTMLLNAIAETADNWRPVEPDYLDSDYLDSQDATEHFTLDGRLRIVRDVANAFDHA